MIHHYPSNLGAFIVLAVCCSAVFAFDNKVRDITNRYDLHETCREGLQAQVNEEMEASIVYQQMAAYFSRNDVARPGFAKFFADNSDEEKEHARAFMEYLTQRGSHVARLNVPMPKVDKWRNALDALQNAVELEHRVNNDIQKLYEKADKDCQDPQLMDFLDQFLKEQVESIDKLKRMVTTLENMDTGMGEYLMDVEIRK